MKRNRPVRKISMMLIAAACGSLCASSCLYNFHDALVTGSTNFLYDVLNQVATNFIDTLQPSSQGN